MKLSQIKEILQIAVANLDVLYQNVVIAGNSYTQISGISDIKQAIDSIASTGLFLEQINSLKDTNMYQHGHGTLSVELSEGQKIRENIRVIRATSQALIQSLEILVGKEEEDIIYIKFPNITTLDELSIHAKNFNIIFSQIIFEPEIGGNIEIKGVENGSFWLKLALGAPAAVALIGSLAWAAAVVYKKMQEARLMEGLVRAQKISNEHKQNVVDVFKTVIDAVVKSETQHLLEEHFPDKKDENELFQRVQNSLIMLSKEIEKGAEINPSLTAPEQVTNLFPDMKRLPLIDSKIKQLPNSGK